MKIKISYKNFILFFRRALDSVYVVGVTVSEILPMGCIVLKRVHKLKKKEMRKRENELLYMILYTVYRYIEVYRGISV